MTGTKTVKETYARKVVDQFLDLYGVINGYDASDEQWKLKRQKYTGPAVFSKCDNVLAWRSHQWRHFQDGLNAVCNRSCWVLLLMMASCLCTDSRRTAGL